MDMPETCYARSGEVAIAYQAFGDGPVDVIWISGIISNVEYQWLEPRFASFLERIGSFSRLIRFDKRGTGLSDRVFGGVPTLEQRMDDVRAVMDDAGSERAVLLGAVEGAPIAILFAATYPERTLGLVLYGSQVKTVWAPDFPWAPKFEEHMKAIDEAERLWGTQRYCDQAAAKLAPSGDEKFRRFWGAYMRHGASPSAAAALMRMNMQIDVRDVLPTIRVPTLILHRRDDPVAHVEQSRYIAQRIPHARYVEVEGVDQVPLVGDTEVLLGEMEAFVGSIKDTFQPDRVLATVLFTDIVDSTVAGRRPRRCALARVARGAPRGRAAATRPLPGPRDRHCGGRLFRDLRRAGARRRVRPGGQSRACATSASSCARACTRASARSATARSRASPSTSAPG